MELRQTISLLFWLSALFLTNKADSQSPLEAYQGLFNQNYTRVELDQKVDSLLTLCETSRDLVSKVEIAHAYALNVIPDFHKSIIYGQIEISLFEQKRLTLASYQNSVDKRLLDKGNFLDSMHTRAAHNLGRFYSIIGDDETAITIYEKMIELQASSLTVGQAYGEIGTSKNKQGDFFNAVIYYKKGIDLLKSIGENENVAIQSINIASSYRNIGTPESFTEGQKALETADSLRKLVDIGKGNVIGLMNDMGNQFISESMFDFKKAYDHYQTGLSLALEEQDINNASLILNNLAHLYNFKQSDSTLYYINKGFEIVKSDDVKARLFDTKSEYYLLKGGLDSALVNIHQALEINLGTTFSKQEVPSILDLSKSSNKDYTIFCMRKKVDILLALYQKSNEPVFLSQAIRNVKAADELIDLIQNGSYESQTKLLWRKAASEIYIKGVYAAHLLNHSEELFYFIEKNRALLLSQEIATNTAFNNLPVFIANKTRALKKAVLRFENEVKEIQQKPAQDSLFMAKQEYENFMDSVKQVYPIYFERKFSISPVSLSEWQQSLKSDTTFLSYIWNKLDDDSEILIGLIVDSTTAKSFAINVDESLKSAMNEYQSLIAQPQRRKQDQNRLNELSHNLFTQLLPDEEIRQMAKQKRLLVVPDGPLQNIPFETLITDPKQREFLLQSTDVSYLYSVSFLYHNSLVDRSASDRFTAYAPVNFKATGLNTLEKTRDELNAIENTIGGKMVLEEKATKKHFLKSSDDYRIIHLATHANAGGTPWIAFADEKLQLHELYTYKNNAELVTLSACNTLVGEMVSGEGVLSLSRGFFYSGAKSVMASLWNVDDQATSSIMADFYTYLDEGQNKSEALTNAKRNYLKTHSLSEQSPYYWSSIVLVGDAGPVDMSISYLHLYLIGFLLVVFITTLFFRKKLNR